MSNEKFAALAEEQKFYETQCENNEEMNRQLDELNSKAVLQRRLNLELTEDTNHLKSEVITAQVISGRNMNKKLNSDNKKSKH